MQCVALEPRRTQETPSFAVWTRLGPTVPQFSSFKALCTPSCLASDAIDESRPANAMKMGKPLKRCPGPQRSTDVTRS